MDCIDDLINLLSNIIKKKKLGNYINTEAFQLLQTKNLMNRRVKMKPHELTK